MSGSGGGPLPRLIGRATDVTPDNVIVQKYLLLRGPGDYAWLAEAELATPELAALYAAYPHKGADPERKGWIRGVTGDNLDARKAQARAAAGRALAKREWLVDFFCSEQPPPAGAPLTYFVPTASIRRVVPAGGRALPFDALVERMAGVKTRHVPVLPNSAAVW